MDIEGLVYLLNQAGVALAQANARIAQLEKQLADQGQPQRCAS